MQIRIRNYRDVIPLTLDLIVALQHKYLQQLHLFALHFEIEGHISRLLYLPLEFQRKAYSK